MSDEALGISLMCVGALIVGLAIGFACGHGIVKEDCLSIESDSPKTCTLGVTTIFGANATVYGNWSFSSNQNPSLVVNMTGCWPEGEIRLKEYTKYIEGITWVGVEVIE